MAAAGGSTERTRSTGLSSERTNVAVLGGGAWGTALALHAARMGHDVLLWALEPEVVLQVNEEHENKTYLKAWGCGGWRASQGRMCPGSCPAVAQRHAFSGGNHVCPHCQFPLLPAECCALQGYALPHNLRASGDIQQVASFGEIILMVIPTPFVERTVGPAALDRLCFGLPWHTAQPLEECS